MSTNEQIEKTTRLRCPFCDSRGIAQNSMGHKECYCTNCGASGPKVKVEWNTRTAQDIVELHIVFQDDGGPANLRFVEVETIDGKSVRAGTWMKRNDYDVLTLSVHRSDIASLPSTPEAPTHE